MKGPLSLLRLCCVLALMGAEAQRLPAQHDWTWTFGDSVVMRFQNGGQFPMVLTGERSRSTFEVGSCYSDVNGDLLLFANEDSIYDYTSGAIPDGRMWFVDRSYTQGLVILPFPATNDSLLIFYLHYGCPNQASPCLAFKVVQVNSPMLIVTRTVELGYPGLPGNGYSEKLQAVRHADGVSWWLYAHDVHNADFYRYLVRPNGVSGPIKQTIGSPHDGFGNNPMYPVGEMTFSQDGEKLLVATGTGVLDLFEVDRCTGELGNWTQISAPALRGPNNWYGCSFSPDGSKVYADELDLPYNSHLYQWDLNAPNIPASKTLIYADTTTDTYWGQHQLGPDGRIYITTASPDTTSSSNLFLAVVNQPNLPGTACNFARYGFFLQGLKTSFNLPNLPNYNLGGLLSQVADAGPDRLVCPGGSVQLGTADTSGGAATFHWTGPGLDDSTSAQPMATLDSSVWYYLTVTDTAYGSPCGTTVDSVLVVVADSNSLPVSELGPDRLMCRGDTIMLGMPSNPQFLYHWTALPPAWMGSPDSSWTLLAGPGSYQLTVNYPDGVGACFSATDAVKVNLYTDTLSSNPAGLDTVVCGGDSLSLGSPSPGPGWVWQWTPSDGLDDPGSPQPLANPMASGLYVMQGRDTAFAGSCSEVMDSVRIIVEDRNWQDLLDLEDLRDTTYCPGECFMIGVPPVAGYEYQWSPVAGLASPAASLTRAQPKGTLTYTLTVTNPALQSANCRERLFPVTVTADDCNLQSFMTVNGNGIAERLDLGDHAGRVELRVWDMAGRLVYQNSQDSQDWEGYQNDWQAAGLAHGVYAYRVSVEGECPATFNGKIVVLR